MTTGSGRFGILPTLLKRVCCVRRRPTADASLSKKRSQGGIGKARKTDAAADQASVML
jgi:hypothetical protein